MCKLKLIRIAFACAFGCVCAESLALPPQGPIELSLSRALQRAQEHAPELLRARTEVASTQARRAGAALPLSTNPAVSFLGGYRREFTSTPTATGFQYQFHLEQALEIAGQRQARLSVVAAQVLSAMAMSDHSRTLSRALVHSTYMLAVLGAERLQVARSREEIAQRLLLSAKARLEVGAASDIEVNLAQIEAGRVAGERVEAEARQEGALGDLRLLCGLPPLVPLRLLHRAEPPHLLTAYQELEPLYMLAETSRSDYRALLRQREVQAAERTRLRREAVPNLVLSFDVQRDLPGQEFFGGSIGMSLPLWNRNQGPLAILAAAERALELEMRLLKTRIRNEVAVAQRKLLLLRSQVEDFQRTALPPAERNLDLLRRGWQAGKFDLFRVITASRELAETRLRYLDMLEALWSATIELERAIGAPVVIGETP